eukprot:jgi/Galph1/977/GphlegSOOS_G5714.1
MFGLEARAEFRRWLWRFLTVRRSTDRLCLSPQHYKTELFQDDQILSDSPGKSEGNSSSNSSRPSWSVSSEVSDSFSAIDFLGNDRVGCVQDSVFVEEMYLLLLFLSGDCVDFGAFLFDMEEEDLRALTTERQGRMDTKKNMRPLWEKWNGLWTQEGLLMVSKNFLNHFGRYSKMQLILAEAEFQTFAEHVAFLYRSRSERLESFGIFELRNCIGKGSFGIVKTARDLTSGKFVAIKKCIHSPVNCSSSWSATEPEVCILKELQDHPSVCRLRNYFSSDQYSYIILEVCGGGSIFESLSTLQDELVLMKKTHQECYTKRKLVGFTEAQIRPWIRDLLSLLVYMHGKCICHRDIRPSNLLLTNNGELRIGDFGSAARFAPGWDLFEGDFVVGSLYSLAPEQIQKKAYSGTKIDIWCTGVLVYWLLAGYPPFPDEDVDVLYKNIKTGNFRLPDISNEAKDFILQAMAVEPESRPDAKTLSSHPWLSGHCDSIGDLLCMSQFAIPLARNEYSKDCSDIASRVKLILKEIFSDVGIYSYDVSFQGVGAQMSVGCNKFKFCLACIASDYYLKFYTCLIHQADNDSSKPWIIKFQLYKGRAILFLKVVQKLRDLTCVSCKERNGQMFER